MKMGSAVTIILISSLVICSSLLTTPIAAQEKVEQIISNITAEQFPNHLSDITLSQEQQKEVETIRDLILYPCVNRIVAKGEPGKLCDAFADYLVDKCKRFDNVLGFCVGGKLGEYELGRNFQISCLKSPPLYYDVDRIQKCLIVTPLNSSYGNTPPILAIGPASKSFNSIEIPFLAQNPAYNSLTFKNITYTFIKEGKKVADGCVSQAAPCRSPPEASLVIKPFSITDYTIEYAVDRKQNQTLVNSPFVANGTYYYHFPNSTIEGKDFDFNITKMEESCVTNYLKC